MEVPWRSMVLFVAVILILLSVHLPSTDARGGRGGGGSRGGGSRGRGSSSRSSSRSTSRRGSRIYSSYIRTVPSVRYTRIYAGYTGYYTYYYSMYFAYARNAVYINRRSPTNDVDVCVNYEANENGTTMGIFTCPLSFEPAEFTSCCGDQYAEYCCKKSGLSGGAIAGIVIGSIIGFIVLFFCIIFCCENCKGCCSCDCESDCCRKSRESESNSWVVDGATRMPTITTPTEGFGAQPPPCYDTAIEKDNGSCMNLSYTSDGAQPPPYPVNSNAMPTPQQNPPYPSNPPYPQNPPYPNNPPAPYPTNEPVAAPAAPAAQAAPAAPPYPVNDTTNPNFSGDGLPAVAPTATHGNPRFYEMSV